MLAGLFRLGTAVVGFALATALFWLGIAYTVYLPPGWPNYRLGVAFVHVTLRLPYAGEVQAVKARAAFDLTQWDQCKANEQQLMSAIASQNASIAALSTEGSRAKAEAETAIQQARKRLASASEAQALIRAPLAASDDVCMRAMVVDQRFTGSLQ